MKSPNQIIDLSIPIRSVKTPVFPVYPMPLKSSYTTVESDGFASFVWTMVDHTATHVDAPSHFVKGGATVDQVPVKRFLLHGVTLDFSRKPPLSTITPSEIARGLKAANEQDVGSGWILLFHTGYTSKAGRDDWMSYPGLGEKACQFIAKMGVDAIGIDAPAPDHEPSPAHKILLRKGICIYENLTNLDKLPSRGFDFIGLPLTLVGGSASPTRAVALIT